MWLTFLQSYANAEGAAIGAVFMVFNMLLMLFVFGTVIIMMVSKYKVFEKAGHPNAWGAFIPIYHLIVLMDVIKQPAYRFLFYLIPLVGFIFVIIDLNRLSKFFGKSEAFTVGMIFLPMIFYPILGFGKSVYIPNALYDNRQTPQYP